MHQAAHSWSQRWAWGPTAWLFRPWQRSKSASLTSAIDLNSFSVAMANHRSAQKCNGEQLGKRIFSRVWSVEINWQLPSELGNPPRWLVLRTIAHHIKFGLHQLPVENVWIGCLNIIPIWSNLIGTFLWRRKAHRSAHTSLNSSKHLTPLITQLQRITPYFSVPSFSSVPLLFQTPCCPCGSERFSSWCSFATFWLVQYLEVGSKALDA